MGLLKPSIWPCCLRTGDRASKNTRAVCLVGSDGTETGDDPINKSLAIVVLVCMSAGLAGCNSLVGLLRPSETTIVLANDSDFDVEVVLFYDDDQNILELLLTEIGEEMRLTIGAGEQITFSRACDDLQAIIIDDADLLVIGQLGPEVKTDVLRDGKEFGCGDTITFTFDHSDAIFDFFITVGFE